MFIAEADRINNRLRITANQALHPDDFDTLIEQICREADKLEPGWVAAIDLRGMWVEDLFFGDRVKLLQATLLGCGAAKIGTLLDNSSIQMYLGQAGVKTHSNQITERFFNETNWEAFLAVRE
jgi:hypothetical protein